MNVVKFKPRKESDESDKLDARVAEIQAESKRLIEVTHGFARRSKLISRQLNSYCEFIVHANKLK